MKQKLLLIIFLILGAYLRLANLPSRVPFDWDQERDMLAVEKMISEKRPTLVGPVVRGEGGFLLGPLYTYLLIPGYIISQGHPLSAPVTNILIDLAVGTTLFILAPVAGAVWFISPLTVTTSLVAWNVGLISLWSLILIILYQKYGKLPTQFLPMFSLFGGLTWHIHASLIPLSCLLLVIYFFINIKKITLRSLILSALAYLLPLAPLIFFDLRHDLVNFKLLQNFLNSSPTDKPEAWSFVIVEIISKLGRFFGSLFNYSGNISPSFFMVFAGLYLIFRYNRKNFFLMTLLIIITLVLLIFYRDPFIPTYYYLPLLLPFVLFTGLALSESRLTTSISLLLLFLAGLYLGNYYRQDSIPFSLTAKEKIVQILASEKTSLDLRYELSPGRGNGFGYLLARAGVQLDHKSSTHAVLKDSATPVNKLDNREPDLFIPLSPYQLEIYRPVVVK